MGEPKVIRHPELGTRAELARLCNDRDIRDGAEVGTDCGEFARDFLQLWQGAFLYCVDPYQPCPYYAWDRETDLLMAITALAPFAGRVRIVRAASPDAAKLLPGPVGFVYIDANHDLESVRADIAAWWEVLRPGGILAGHDFDEHHWEVRLAVTEFATAHDLPIHLTGGGFSWWVDKPR